MSITTIGIDLAKNIFQVHGVTEDGRVAFNKPLRRARILPFFLSYLSTAPARC